MKKNKNNIDNYINEIKELKNLLEKSKNNSKINDELNIKIKEMNNELEINKKIIEEYKRELEKKNNINNIK